MSSSNAKPPLRDPIKPPDAGEVDRHLGPFSRYARTVRGAARVAGLSCKLTWTNQGWIECMKLGESLIGNILLVRVPPVAEIGVSKAAEELMLASTLPEAVKNAIRSASGQNIKWVEIPLIGLDHADAAAALVTTKVDLIESGRLPLSPAERVRPQPKPDLEASEAKPVPAAPKAKPAAAKVVAPKAASKSPAKGSKASPSKPATKRKSVSKPAASPSPKKVASHPRAKAVAKKKAAGSRK